MVVSSALGLSHLLVLNLLKVVLAWAAESFRFSVDARHHAGPCAVRELPGKQKLQQQLLMVSALQRCRQEGRHC